jgi:hypothetical protein
MLDTLLLLCSVFCLSAVVHSAPFALFMHKATRAQDVQDAKRWRVAGAITAIAIVAFSPLVILLAPLMLVIALNLIDVLRLVLLRDERAVAAALTLCTTWLPLSIAISGGPVLVTACIAWRIRAGFDYWLDVIWDNWGWKRWLAFKLPADYVPPLVRRV